MSVMIQFRDVHRWFKKLHLLTDINPISVYENGASVVDAGIIIEKEELKSWLSKAIMVIGSGLMGGGIAQVPPRPHSGEIGPGRGSGKKDREGMVRLHLRGKETPDGYQFLRKQVCL